MLDPFSPKRSAHCFFKKYSYFTVVGNVGKKKSKMLGFGYMLLVMLIVATISIAENSRTHEGLLPSSVFHHAVPIGQEALDLVWILKLSQNSVQCSPTFCTIICLSWIPIVSFSCFAFIFIWLTFQLILKTSSL